MRSYFSTTELLALGGHAADLHDWGMSAVHSLGCLCTELIPPARMAALGGRPTLGLHATAAADLNLRVAILLGELRLPAGLAPLVLAFAMRDFVDQVRPTDGDDGLALVRAGQSVSRERIEDYIAAAAAAGGPLVAAAPMTLVRVP